MTCINTSNELWLLRINNFCPVASDLDKALSPRCESFILVSLLPIINHVINHSTVNCSPQKIHPFMLPTSEDTTPLLPSVDEFSLWDEEQVVEFLLSHSKEINALTHERMLLLLLITSSSCQSSLNNN